MSQSQSTQTSISNAVWDTDFPQFVISIPDPSKAGRRIPARFVEAETSDIDFWYKNIAHRLKKEKRFDARWDWKSLIKPSSIKARIFRFANQEPKLFALRATSNDGTEITIGLMYLVLKYPSPFTPNSVHPFVVYISKAASCFIRERFQCPLSVMLPFVDTAIQQSKFSGYNGLIALHSDPQGGKKLTDTYEEIGLKKLSTSDASLTFARRVLQLKSEIAFNTERIDGDYYYYADLAAINSICFKADRLRRPIEELQ